MVRSTEEAYFEELEVVLGLRALLALEDHALSPVPAKQLTTSVTTVLGCVIVSSDLLGLLHTWGIHTCTRACPHTHNKKRKRRSLISKRLRN